MYEIEVMPSCEKAVRKACKKNAALERVIERKISEIRQNPERYKPLKHDFSGEYMVHILKSFVLIFTVSVERQCITLISFAHHDDVYRR